MNPTQNCGYYCEKRTYWFILRHTLTNYTCLWMYAEGGPVGFVAACRTCDATAKRMDYTQPYRRHDIIWFMTPPDNSRSNPTKYLGKSTAVRSTSILVQLRLWSLLPILDLIHNGCYITFKSSMSQPLLGAHNYVPRSSLYTGSLFPLAIKIKILIT